MKHILPISFLLFILSFSSQSHSQATGQTINSYAAVTAYIPCSNSLTVDSTTGFSVGDTVLMIQMKGATIDSSNTINFGNVTNYNGCGNYEYNVVSAINGNNISLLYVIVRNYDIPNGKVQLVKVPSYSNYTVSQQLTCMPWNGNKGGVFALNVTNTLTLNANIDVSENGFRGASNTPTVISMICGITDFCMAPNLAEAAPKGEGITDISTSKSYARGKLANGGGGGNGHNGGGGGGSNGNTGGDGGSEYGGCNPSPDNSVTSGIGGLQLSYSTASNKIFLGGGGGSGHANNGNASVGGNGGGICIIAAGTIAGNGYSILSNGKDALACINTGGDAACHDGMGGGGAGGTILIKANNISSSLNTQAKGGVGANDNANGYYPEIGPGGGGSGGIVWISTATVNSNLSTNVSGGANGIVVFDGVDWGAQPGQAGQVLTDLNTGTPTDTFINTNAAADFTYNRTSCFTFAFTDESTVISGTITSWQWTFGDGSTSSDANPVHAFSGYGTYTVTLTVQGADGCNTATISKTINIPYVHFAQADGDTSVCGNIPVQLNASGGTSYTWTPATGLNSSTIANPVATISTSTIYKVTAEDSLGCIDSDSVNITIIPAPDIVITASGTKICGSGSVQLSVEGVTNPHWSPGTGLSDSLSNNPIAAPLETTTYVVADTNSAGCTGSDSITISVYPLPYITATADKDSITCANPQERLHASGGVSYQWTPAALLDNPLTADPLATLGESTAFIVTGTDANGCQNTDTVYVALGENKTYFIPNAFSPNGDGLNDVFLPLYYCNFHIKYFFIFNRWGQRVFSTDNPTTGWDGTQNGEPSDIGVYFWYIEGTTADNKTIIRKGDVSLMK